MIRINPPKLMKMCNSCNKMHHTSNKYTTTQYGYAIIERKHKNIFEQSKLDHKSNISHPAIVCIPSRKLSTSSKLNHEIKCVTNSYYEDLGLESTASSHEIKEAFYRLSKECHPDKVGEDNIEALLQFQAISEAYATLSDPKLRRKYDRGVLGRASSAADREASKHKFEGDAFIQGRAAFREEFSGSGRRLTRRDELDKFVTRTTSETFALRQSKLQAESELAPTAVDEHGRSVRPRSLPERFSRPTYSDYSNPGFTAQKTKSGGGGIMTIVVLALVIVIIRKLL